MISASTAHAVTSAEFGPARAAAWDQISKGELAFDFTLPATRNERPAFEIANEKSGVKEAILRWLEEQL
jgi:hypothetical protein